MADTLHILDDLQLDENLRLVQIGDVLSPLELSKTDIRATGDLEVVGDLKVAGNIIGEVTDLTFGDIVVDSITVSGDLDIATPSGDITLTPTGADVKLNTGAGVTMMQFQVTTPYISLFSAANQADSFSVACTTNGATLLSTTDADDALAHLNIEADGHVEFDGCAVGFDLETPTYNASDTDVSFITGNKQFVTFGSGNITDLNLIFPKTSGNFTLLLKQDGTGSRTVTNYKVWDVVNSDAASGSATVKFAGGSNPTLTTDANHVDIISFFYDADNQIAYGVASLDFQF